MKKTEILFVLLWAFLSLQPIHAIDVDTRFYNVGQGLCTFTSCNKEGLLFDCGSVKYPTRKESKSIIEGIGNDIIKEIKNKKIKTIDIVVSHTDKDHYSLLPPLFVYIKETMKTENTKIGKIIVGGAYDLADVTFTTKPPTTGTIESLNEFLARQYLFYSPDLTLYVAENRNSKSTVYFEYRKSMKGDYKFKYDINSTFFQKNASGKIWLEVLDEARKDRIKTKDKRTFPSELLILPQRKTSNSSGSRTFTITANTINYSSSVLQPKLACHSKLLGIDYGESETNDASAIVKINGQLLLTGDATLNSLRYFYKNNQMGNLKSDILQVPHHGASLKIGSFYWADYVNADYLIISAGPGNGFGHPRCSSLSSYAFKKNAHLSTFINSGTNGDIVCASDESLTADYEWRTPDYRPNTQGFPKFFIMNESKSLAVKCSVPDSGDSKCNWY